jgi:signal transduction histidine kinase
MILRRTLTAIVTGLVVLVLMLATLLYLGVRGLEAHAERSRLAHEVLEAYLRLSADTLQQMRRLEDTLTLAPVLQQTAIEAARAQFDFALDDLRMRIGAEIDALDDPQARAAKQQAYATLEELGRLAGEGFGAVEAAARMKAQGAGDRALARLSRDLETTINGAFVALIAEAIEGEQRAVAGADREAAALAARLDLGARLIAAGAVLFGLLAGGLLLVRIRRPVDALITGTRAFAAGNLGHRIEVRGGGELAELAESFNTMAAELARQRQDLQAAVAERTVELAEVNAELRRVDEERRRFFADVSQELHTPLTVIRDEAEATLRGADTPESDYRHALRRIVELAGGLARLVDDLLFVARAQDGAAQAQQAPVALREVVGCAVADAEVLALRAELRLEVDLPAEDLQVLGDAERLRQLMLILLDNACRYSDAGGQIRIESHAAAGHLHLVVSDQGIGIPADELDAVFTRFYRGAEARQRVPNGSGIGLPLARAIARAHGGDIEVSSRPGAGTRFTVMLPRLDTTQTAQREARQGLGQVLGEGPDGDPPEGRG